MGNINTDSSFNIWNGDLYNNFRLQHCQQTYKNMNECQVCVQPKLLHNSYDNLDSKRDFLSKYYSRKGRKNNEPT